ncbi:probable UDP-arabinopyranose mutase 5 isoform X2 [Chenopodium quinoa]|uniref:probable UDP-arabinopyranose mutase 5 isoform X2 n=1 Tax=Chenopodium quinoa TaxID=63459 RepID=UPI000B790217|nr:probable UDP-arabinopyranose mutase 5 isoform X2 [Chenopodium quinoa]
MTTTPPSLLSLTIDSALLHLSSFSDLSHIPDHILIDLFRRTLKAGKLNERILNLFIASGDDKLLSFIKELNIRPVYTPVLPTRNIKDDDVDIVIGALQSDLTSFMNAWKPIFSRFHLIIVKDPELKEDLKIPDGFDVKIYTKADMDKTAGASLTSQLFSGYSCRYFGYLVSSKKYVISIDDDCIPAKDDKGFQVDAVAQHLFNLAVPATPLFFNTLYDPFCKGADFVRGYPFSMREGVPCALSCGLWLNLADLDAPTQALKPEQRNTRYVDAVLTVPAKALMPLSGINIGFNRELLGPALFPGLKLTKEGKLRWETMEDVFSGMCVKVVCDHLKFGVKTGLPYVWREERGDAVQSLKKDWEGMKLMEDAVPFFESIKLPAEAVKAEDCLLEIAKLVKERFAAEKNSVFIQAADAMTEWVNLWKKVVPASN